MIHSSFAPSVRLFPSIWKLVRLRLRLNWNSFKHAKTRRKIGTILIVLLVAGFAGFIFFLSWLLLGFLHSPNLTRYVGFDVAPFLQSVPVLIFAALFLGILFSSFGVLLQALYLSGDMDFLLTSPVPIRAVFVTKLLQAVLPNFGLIALFGLPVLIGLGISNHYGGPDAGSRRSIRAAGHAGGAPLSAPAGGGGVGVLHCHPLDPVFAERQPLQFPRTQRQGFGIAGQQPLHIAGKTQHTLEPVELGRARPGGIG
jgi:hypothetical protein